MLLVGLITNSHNSTTSTLSLLAMYPATGCITKNCFHGKHQKPTMVGFSLLVLHFLFVKLVYGVYPALEVLTPLVSWSHHEELVLCANVWNHNNGILEGFPHRPDRTYA